jgi:hypothetical protein
MRNFRLSRRACLAGMGATLALPLLEAMRPALASAQSATPPLRFLTVFVPNGIRMDRFKPVGTGANWALSPILTPLAPFKSDLTVVSGLANYPASIVSQEFAGSHARAAGALLTQSPLAFTAGADIRNGISLDQVIANQVKTLTRFPSLEVGVRAGSAAGDCEDGFSCAYLHNISWSGPKTPMRKMTSPRDVFNRLFASGTTTPPPVTDAGQPLPVIDKTALYERSILDKVAGRAKALNQQLGKTDREKLDEYFTAVRAVEEQLARVGQTTPSADGGTGLPATQCVPGAPPIDPGTDYKLHLDLMSDMIALAFQCDLTRVATFMMEDALNGTRSFRFLNVTGQHHELSHHGGDTTKLDALQTINTFEVERFAYLIGKLKSTLEGSSSILDNSVVLFTSDFGDGDDHYHWDLPMLVVGKGGGKFKTGQHIIYPHTSGNGPSVKGDKPMANLFINVLQAFGINQSTFGTDGVNPYGTAPLAELEP